MAVRETVLLLLIILASPTPTTSQGCNKALGMESGAISCKQISASSYQADHAPRRGRLRFEVTPGQVGSWSARILDANQWLQIDMGSQPDTIITGVATQGGTEFRNRNRWVTNYNLQYSDDGVNFQFYKEQGSASVKEFVGNSNRNTVVYHDLNPPITARYIRFRPTAWNNWISMRVELYGCKAMEVPCYSNPCLNGGTCSDEGGGDYTCQCNNGWEGEQCDVNFGKGLEQSVVVGKKKELLGNLTWFLKSVSQSGHHWELCWRASRDGWEGSRFHDYCNGNGPTVTIIKVNSHIFGGYTSTSWTNSNPNCDHWYIYDTKSFIFSLVSSPPWGPVKLFPPGGWTYYKSNNYAIDSCSKLGPSFGYGDISIYGHREGLSKLGGAYHKIVGTDPSSFLAGSYRFTPDEIEVFYETT